MKKTAFAFAAAIVLSTFAASTADAMTIGSLSRQRPMVDSVELTTSSIPSACRDLACGGNQISAAAAAPTTQAVFASIGEMVGSHLDRAFKRGAQIISMLSAN